MLGEQASGMAEGASTGGPQPTDVNPSVGPVVQPPSALAVKPDGNGTTSPIAVSPPGQTPPPVAVNWDDPANPHRASYEKLKAQHDGLQGVFKQEKARREALEAQVAGTQARLAALEAERQRQAQVANEAQIDQVLQGDPEEAVAKLRAEREKQKLLATVVPQAQRQAYDQAVAQTRQQYEAGMFAAAEDAGLSRAQVLEVAQESGGDFGKFFTALRQRMADAQRDSVLKELKEANARELAEMRAALRQEFLAGRRAAEPSPDTSVGQPPAPDADRTFLADYAAGRVSDHKRARGLLGM